MSYFRIPFLATLMLLVLVSVPVSAEAASSKTSCTLTVTTPRGDTTFDKDEDVYVLKGEAVTVAWESKNATKATDSDGDTIDTEDSVTLSPTKDTTLEYRFTGKGRRAECEVTLKVVEASFDAATLSTSTTKPTISGEVEGLKSVWFEVENEDGKRVFKSKTLKPRKGEWSAKLSKPLAEGVYNITLFGDKKAELNVLATSTLEILEKGSTSSQSSSGKKVGTLSVSALPLLSGGNAGPGASVPIAYIRVANGGSVATSIEGFTLKQNGSASTDAVVGFSTSDDKGGSRSTTSGAGLFKNGSAYVPLPGVIEPGQTRIFTIKALLAANSASYTGQALMLDVSGVNANASVPSAFPIRGTTWTLTY